MPRNRKQRALVVAVAAVAATAAGGGTAVARPERPAARKAPQATVDRLVVPRGGVLGHWGRMTVSARVRQRAVGPARLSVVFHLSRDRRWDRRDPRLGTVRTRRLARGRAATVRLRTGVSSALGYGRWNVLACVGAGARRRCAAAPLMVWRPENDALHDAPPHGHRPPTPQKPPVQTYFSAAPVLQLDDGVAWGALRRADGSPVGPGDTVTTTLRLGASVRGWSYLMTEGRPLHGEVTGRETVLLDAATAPSGADLDEGAVAARLPFAFPLAGVETREVSISANGWLSTAGPAFSSGRDWREDYRGDAAIGANLAAVAPLWEDLTLTGPAGSAPGRIVLVEPPSGDRVAIRWEVYPADGDPATERGLQVFQATLYADGSIDFLYPVRGALPAGFTPTIGISPGVTGRLPQLTTEPGPPPEDGRGFLAQPEPSADPAPGVVLIEEAPAGTATLTLPRGSVYVGGSPACRVAVPSTFSAEGRVDCATPVIPRRNQATVEVSWTYPPPFVGAVTQQATWTADGRTSTADAELLDGHFRDAAGATLDVTPDATAEGSRPGLEIEAQAATADAVALRDPLLTGTLPAGLEIEALRAGGVRVAGAELKAACPQLPDGAAGGTFACRLPNGLGLGFLATVVLEQPASGSYPVTVALEADNLPAPVQDAATLVIP